MINKSISIFGSKILLEIVKEIKLLSNFEFNYYTDLNSCLNESENKLLIIFLDKESKYNYNNLKKINSPILFISESLNSKYKSLSAVSDNLKAPFSIISFEKKIISLFSKKEYIENSLINLGEYIIDKNERKIKKNNNSLKLSEKEINFLVLFSTNKGPLNKSFVLKEVWNYSSESETHTVETHIHRLRKKILEKFNDNNFIKNNNKGYYI